MWLWRCEVATEKANAPTLQVCDGDKELALELLVGFALAAGLVAMYLLLAPTY